jgi:hypothetical protein
MNMMPLREAQRIAGGLFTGVTLLWSSGAASNEDVGFVLWNCRRGKRAAGDQHAVGFPGDVALEAADDLWLALALRDSRGRTIL